MALYLLDKNVVEDIRKSLRNIPSPGTALARRVDRKGNTISPILAIAEGSRRQPQSSIEFHDSLISATQDVAMFYHHARTDANALREMGSEMAVTLSRHWREKTTELIPLCNAIQMLLARTYSVRDARDVLTQIDALRRTYNVERRHPLITCAVACLYAHMGARRVLKPAVNPTTEDSYNAIADIRMLLDAAYIGGVWQEDIREPVHFLSSDKNLNTFSKVIKVVAQSSLPLRDLRIEVTEFRATISTELFPSLMSKPEDQEHVMAFFEAA